MNTHSSKPAKPSTTGCLTLKSEPKTVRYPQDPLEHFPQQFPAAPRTTPPPYRTPDLDRVKLKPNCNWMPRKLSAAASFMRIRSIAAFSRLIAQHFDSGGGAASQESSKHSAIPSLGPVTGRPHVSFRNENGYSIIELCNPLARNALTPHM